MRLQLGHLLAFLVCCKDDTSNQPNIDHMRKTRLRYQSIPTFTSTFGHLSLLLYTLLFPLFLFTPWNAFIDRRSSHLIHSHLLDDTLDTLDDLDVVICSLALQPVLYGCSPSSPPSCPLFVILLFASLNEITPALRRFYYFPFCPELLFFFKNIYTNQRRFETPEAMVIGSVVLIEIFFE